MTTNYQQVCEFHESFSVPIGDDVVPFLPGNRLELRLGLIEEEHKEVLEAVDEGDPAHIAKELCDLLYVVYGMGIEYGFDMDACFAEVHRSNMTKLDEDGRPVVRASDGKVLKGSRYEEANLKEILFGRSGLGVESRYEAKERSQ